MSESAFFFEVDGGRVFAVLHRPLLDAPSAGVVICHALGEEKYWSHRALVGVARELAQSGIAVLRFDFRGEGDSDLEFEESGIATRVADALGAAQLLLERHPQFDSVVLLGHRLGAAIAAAAARRLGPRARGVVLWDPVNDGRRYLFELLRATLASRLAIFGSAPTRAALIAALEAGETVNVEGYGFTPGFYRELIGLSLSEMLSGLGCPALTIDAGGSPPPWRESRYHVQAAPDVTRGTHELLKACA